LNKKVIFLTDESFMPSYYTHTQPGEDLFGNSLVKQYKLLVLQHQRLTIVLLLDRIDSAQQE
jgi:hypothetical protein